MPSKARFGLTETQNPTQLGRCFQSKVELLPFFSYIKQP